MESLQFMTNPHYVDYVRGLRQLHELEMLGEDQSARADDVRDTMDLPWRGLVPAEIDRVRDLSSDLNSLCDPQLSGTRSTDLNEWQRRYQEAHSIQDRDALLALIRLDPGPMPPADVAFARSRWWHELGDGESALLFAEEAARLDPTRWNIAYFRSYLLSKLDREDEAIGSLVDFAEDHSENVPETHRETCQQAIEDRRKAREAATRLHDNGLALIRDWSISHVALSPDRSTPAA